MLHASEAPLLLTHDCAGWREIALADPLLWSSLHISLPSGDDIRRDYHPRENTPLRNPSGTRLVVEAWLDRSGTHPLDISVYSQTNLWDYRPWKSSFYLFAPRWGKMTFDLPFSLYHDDNFRFLQLQDLILPLLEDITFRDTYSESWFGLNLELLKQAPRLRRVVFSGMYLDGASFFRHHQLKELRFDDFAFTVDSGSSGLSTFFEPPGSVSDFP